MVNKYKQIWHHPWIVAGCNMLLIMGLYTITRIFFYLFNQDLYPAITASHLMEMLLGGIRFDLTSLLYLNSLYLLLILLPLPLSLRNSSKYIKATQYCYLLPNIIGIIVNCIDMVYVRFTDRRTTCTIFTEFQNDNNILEIVWQAVWGYWYVTIFGLVCIVILWLACRKKWEVTALSSKRYYLQETIILLLTIYFIVIGIRGGFGKYTRPITISNALQYADTPQETAIILNTPFTLLKSIENTSYVNPSYFNNIEVEQIMSPIHTDKTKPNCSTIQLGELGKTNVVILILESFSKEYIGFYNTHLQNGKYKGYTPFLDSLLQHCITYKYSYASGRKSIDAMPSILSSIPMLIEPYIVTPYSTNAISSIADCLRGEGYTTAFFHGAPNGSMGFQAFARAVNFEHYYGMNEYDGIDAFDGTWAIWDEEFLQYYGKTMSSMQEPFMTAVFTASSHHPFRVPKRYEGVFPKGDISIHQCIGYTDHALREFFAYAAQQPWYANTLFVITADHTNEISLPEYANAKGLFEVPIAFFSPRWNHGKLEESYAVSQTDIMPSILSYLEYNKPYFAFGQDILTQPKQTPYAICYNHPVFQIFSDSLLIQYDGKNTTAVYKYQEDPLLEHNIAPQTDHKMLRYLQAYIQQYINRLINNQLTIDTNGNSSR